MEAQGAWLVRDLILWICHFHQHRAQNLACPPPLFFSLLWVIAKALDCIFSAGGAGVAFLHFDFVEIHGFGVQS